MLSLTTFSGAMFIIIQCYTSIQTFQPHKLWKENTLELSLMTTKQSTYHAMQGLLANLAANTPTLNIIYHRQQPH